MEKMTLHRALSELKLIDKKLSKLNETIEPIGWKQVKKLVNGKHDEKEFIDKAKADFQKANDLFARRVSIKAAIAKANNETLVEINGEKMTITHAINRKHMAEQRKKFPEALKRIYSAVNNRVEDHNGQIERNALQIAQAALGKDNVKLTDKDVVNVTQPYIANNELIFVDPLNLLKTIEKLEEEQDVFDAEVDAVLSEANAMTFISI